MRQGFPFLASLVRPVAGMRNCERLRVEQVVRLTGGQPFVVVNGPAIISARCASSPSRCACSAVGCSSAGRPRARASCNAELAACPPVVQRSRSAAGAHEALRHGELPRMDLHAPVFSASSVCPRRRSARASLIAIGASSRTPSELRQAAAASISCRRRCSRNRLITSALRVA